MTIVLALAVIAAMIIIGALVMGTKSGAVTVKSIVTDYEAKLFEPDDGPRRGKSGWEEYGDGEKEFYVRFRNLDVPEGSTVDIVINGHAVHSLDVTDGKARWYLHSNRGDDVLLIHDGDHIEIQLDGRVVLVGDFEPD